MELPKITLPKIEPQQTTFKPRICNEPIVITQMVETRIFPNGTTYVRTWVVGEAKVINSQNKPKPKEKKILTDFSKQDEDEVI